MKKAIFLTCFILPALLFVRCSSRTDLSLSEYMDAMPDRYDARGFLQVKTDKEIGNWTATFYVIKYNAAKNHKNNKEALAQVEDILYWYGVAGNTEATNKWKEVQQQLKEER